MTVRPSLFRHILTYILLVILLVTIFLGAYIAKRHYGPSSIIFYEGNILAIAVFCAGMAVFCVGLVAHRGQPGQWPWREQMVGALVTALFINYSFVTTIPSLLDRSISIFVIAATAKAGPQGIAIRDLAARFDEGYVDGEFQVRKRVEEQLTSRNMVMKDDSVWLTERGQFVYRTNIFLAKLLNINSRYVLADKTMPPLP